MSYILDALKKSEKERQRGALPDMLTVQDIVAEKPSKRVPWVYLLAAALLLNAGVLVWWLGFSHINKANVVKTSTTGNISPLSVNDAAPAVFGRVKPYQGSTQSGFRPSDRSSVPVIENNETTTSVENPPPPKGLQEVKPHPVSADNATKSSEPASAKSGQSAGTGQIPSDPTGGLSEMPDGNKLYKLQELPSAIRQNLPAFSVTALLYSSNPDSRMVRINEQMMHEGQDLIAGIKLEEISRDGIILSYQKYRFYVAVK